MAPATQLVERFRSDLDVLVEPGARIGVAVSGGPDSLALLALAAAARPGLVEGATVDHALRPEARAEGEMVAGVCERLGVPHEILTAEWDEPPETAIQERARAERYRLLAAWASARGLAALVTAHHLDDQAETFAMRLARGSGARGLAGMRPVALVPGSDLPLIRPLLSWRRSALEAICAEAQVTPALDPSNSDDRFERVRIRRALGESDWLDPEVLARSAANLAAADAALDWAAEAEWNGAVVERDGEILYRPEGTPDEIVRRIVARAIALLATEGGGAELRGRELDRLIDTLAAGGRSTLRGVLCSGGTDWRFIPAPNRTGFGGNSR